MLFKKIFVSFFEFHKTFELILRIFVILLFQSIFYKISLIIKIDPLNQG